MSHDIVSDDFENLMRTIKEERNAHKNQYTSFCSVSASMALLFCSQDKQSFHFCPEMVRSGPTYSQSSHVTPAVMAQEELSYFGSAPNLFTQSEEQFEFGVTSMARAVALINKTMRVHERQGNLDGIWSLILMKQNTRRKNGWVEEM